MSISQSDLELGRLATPQLRWNFFQVVSPPFDVPTAVRAPEFRLQDPSPSYRYPWGDGCRTGGLLTYFAGKGTSVADAANFSFVELFNPMGSNVDAFVYRLVMNIDSGNPVGILRVVAAQGSVVATVHSLDFAQPLPKAGIRSGVEGAITGQQFAELGVGTNTMPPFPEAPPIHVPPGFGVKCAAATVNFGLMVSFEWFEREVSPTRFG